VDAAVVDAQAAFSEREISAIDSDPALYDFCITNDDKGGAAGGLAQCAEDAHVGNQVRIHAYCVHS
jgi:hypothetical protein